MVVVAVAIAVGVVVGFAVAIAVGVVVGVALVFGVGARRFGRFGRVGVAVVVGWALDLLAVGVGTMNAAIPGAIVDRRGGRGPGRGRFGKSPVTLC